MNGTARDREPLVIGVDVGGTKIAAGVVDACGDIVGRVRLPTDVSRPESTLRTIVHAIHETITDAQIPRERIKAVGLGIPGKVDHERGIGLLSVNLGWQDVAVADYLEQALGWPCAIENDVSVAALGESRYGIGADAQTIIYVSLGTGIAARMIINGQLYRGSHGLAGELGHAIFLPQGPHCKCGARGCLEALASGPAIARRARERMLVEENTLLSRMLVDTEVRAEEVFAAAAQGDALACQILEETGSWLAYAIHLLALAFDPQRVVLGGGMAQEGPLLNAIRAGVENWSRQAPLMREVMAGEQVHLSSLGVDSAILGAAAIAYDKHRHAE